MNEGKVIGGDDVAVTPETPYRPESTVRYFREVEHEEKIPFEEEIIFQNEDMLIADKPHFLPVVPTGPYVNECLLARLRRRTGIDELTPVHRLDRETAGLVLFSVRRETRPLYHRLFADRAITKEYLAVGAGDADIADEFTIANRLVPGEPWFRMRIDGGEANAFTHVEVIGRDGGRGLFRLRPKTGRKHQLRIHLLSIGYPIVNDQLYPDVHPHAPYDFPSPLGLLAKRISFIDPVSGEDLLFESGRVLSI